MWEKYKFKKWTSIYQVWSYQSFFLDTPWSHLNDKFILPLGGWQNSSTHKIKNKCLSTVGWIHKQEQIYFSETDSTVEHCHQHCRINGAAFGWYKYDCTVKRFFAKRRIYSKLNQSAKWEDTAHKTKAFNLLLLTWELCATSHFNTHPHTPQADFDNTMRPGDIRQLNSKPQCVCTSKP